MQRFIKWLFIGLVLLQFAAVLLGYNAIASMKRQKVPPFIEGLYTWVWRTPPPPSDIVLWFDSLTGRGTVIMALIVIPTVLGYVLFRFRWRVVGLGGMIVTSSVATWMGSWMWIWVRRNLE